MRNPNFRFVGQWAKQFGGAGAPLGAAILSANPVTETGFKRADLCTEADIAAVRAAGVLPPTPTFTTGKGYGVSGAVMGGPGTIVYDQSIITGQCRFAAGGDWVVFVSSDTAANFTAALYLGMGSGIRLSPFLANTVSGGNLVPSVSYCNGEFNVITDSGVFSFSLQNKLPNTDMQTLSVRHGTTSPLQASGQPTGQKLIFFNGVYVAYAPDYIAHQIRYSTDRVTWTACTVPTLNGNASNQGPNISAITVSYDRTQLIAVTSYGETLTSPDGITWTKTNTRAVNLSLPQIISVAQSPSGKLFCGQVVGTADQLLTAANVNSPFVGVATGLGTGGVPASVLFHAGLLWVMGTATTIVGMSADNGGSWTKLPGTLTEGAITNQLAALVGLCAQQGTVWLIGSQQNIDVPPSFIRFDMDWGKMTAPVLNPATNTISRWYVKVA